MTAPSVTLFFGPQTRLGLALNSIIRQNRVALQDAGLSAYPSRIGDKALRNVAEGKPVTGVRNALELDGWQPVLLTAMKAIGAPSNTFRSGNLMPDAGALLAGLSPLFSDLTLHVVLTIDPLHHFLHAMNHAAPNAAVRATSWDRLYEIRWSSIVRAVSLGLPNAEISVLTTRSAFINAELAISAVFGAASSAIPPDVLRRAILPAMADAPKNPRRLSELFDASNPRATPEWLREELGIDAVTASLLDDRFAEDLDTIRALPRVRLI